MRQSFHLSTFPVPLSAGVINFTSYRAVETVCLWTDAASTVRVCTSLKQHDWQLWEPAIMFPAFCQDYLKISREPRLSVSCIELLSHAHCQLKFVWTQGNPVWHLLLARDPFPLLFHSKDLGYKAPLLPQESTRYRRLLADVSFLASPGETHDIEFVVHAVSHWGVLVIPQDDSAQAALLEAEPFQWTGKKAQLEKSPCCVHKPQGTG